MSVMIKLYCQKRNFYSVIRTTATCNNLYIERHDNNIFYNIRSLIIIIRMHGPCKTCNLQNILYNHINDSCQNTI